MPLELPLFPSPGSAGVALSRTSEGYVSRKLPRQPRLEYRNNLHDLHLGEIHPEKNAEGQGKYPMPEGATSPRRVSNGLRDSPRASIEIHGSPARPPALKAFHVGCWAGPDRRGHVLPRASPRKERKENPSRHSGLSGGYPRGRDVCKTGA